MGLRESINQNSAVVTIITLLILIACVVFIVRGLWGGRTAKAGDVYYYDLNTGKLFFSAASMEELIEAPSGAGPDGKPAGVRAYIISCGKCANYDGMSADEVEQAGGFLAYLHYTPKPPPMAEGPAGMGPALHGLPDAQLRAVAGGSWVSASSPEGDRLIAAVKEHCAGGGDVSICYP
jgi:hypothetical protein